MTAKLRLISNSPDTVDLLIDEQNLIDLIHAHELPFATKEGSPGIAGSYQGLPAKVVFLPSRHLLGEPLPLYSDDAGKTQLLECDCGEAGCWLLLARVTVSTDRVIWDEFEQPHRGPTSRASHWRYGNLPPFIFDRCAYEMALAPQNSESTADKA